MNTPSRMSRNPANEDSKPKTLDLPSGSKSPTKGGGVRESVMKLKMKK